MQNKYNTFRRLLKISLYYRVKNKSLKMLQLLYHAFMTKLSTPPFFHFFKRKRNMLLYVVIYCLIQQRVYQSRVHDVERLLDIWQGLQQSAVDSATDGLHARSTKNAGPESQGPMRDHLDQRATDTPGK